MAVETSLLWVRTLLPRPAAPYFLLKREGPAKGILLALPITPLLFIDTSWPSTAPCFTLSPPTAKVLMWGLPGATGGAQGPQEPGALAGKSCARRLR